MVDLDHLCDQMFNNLKESIETVDELEKDGADDIDVLCDRNHQVGYQTAMNELRKALGKEPIELVKI